MSLPPLPILNVPPAEDTFQGYPALPGDWLLG